MRIRTVEQAAKWVDEVGLALLYPNGDYVVPSLWEAATGHSDMDWEAPETWTVWAWKDELPAERLACVGLHVARTSSIVAPALVAAVYALTADKRETLRGLERRSPMRRSSSVGPRRAASCGCSLAPTSGSATAR